MYHSSAAAGRPPPSPRYQKADRQIAGGRPAVAEAIGNTVQRHCKVTKNPQQSQIHPPENARALPRAAIPATNNAIRYRASLLVGRRFPSGVVPASGRGYRGAARRSARDYGRCFGGMTVQGIWGWGAVRCRLAPEAEEVHLPGEAEGCVEGVFLHQVGFVFVLAE